MYRTSKQHCGRWLYGFVAIYLYFGVGMLWGNEEKRRDRVKYRSDQFVVLFQDGTVVKSGEIRDWYEDRRHPNISGRRLFDKRNPARLVRNRDVEVKAVGPRVEFANGDVLPGTVVRAMAADASRGAPSRLVVTLRAPLIPWNSKETEISIRHRHIARVVLSERPQGPISPGTVVLADGRRVKIKALRWTITGIAALTADSSFRASWVDLAEVHPPKRDCIEALMDDAISTDPSGEGLLGRIVTRDGGVLTYRRSMMRITKALQRERGRKGPQYDHAVQPAWSLSMIRVPYDEIGFRTYRRSDEIPLSLLPARTISQRSFTGHQWEWKRNANLHGAALHSGTIQTRLGIGMHSYSAVEFQLPPDARELTSWVGMDRAVGEGGCVKASILADGISGKVLFRSKHLRGSDGVVRLSPITLGTAKTVVMVVDFGHEGRPSGADPLDIRDELNWLLPMVRVDSSKVKARRVSLAQSVPQLSGWTLDDATKKRLTPQPYWDLRLGRWYDALMVDRKRGSIDRGTDLRFSRTVVVTHSNAWLDIVAGHVIGDGFEVYVEVDGKRFGSIMNGHIKTERHRSVDQRKWSLGSLIGKRVKVSVVVKAMGNRVSGLVLHKLSMGPIVTNLSSSGKPIKPDVPLSSLEPLKVTFSAGKDEIRQGKLYSGRDLTIRGLAFKDGFGIPDGDSEITYLLNKKYKAFVAVIGLSTEGWRGVGPYQILLDGEEHVTTEVLGRLDPAKQWRVEIPAGHKVLTIRLKGQHSHPAFGNPGFMVR